MSIDTLLFEAEDLSKLEPGQVRISAPSFRGSLQINTITFDDRIPLDITVADGDVTVRRVDEQPILVDINGNLLDNHNNLRHPVFYRPQPEVRFMRHDDELWGVVNDQDVIDGSFRIGVFADVISLYALQHQQRQRRQLTQRFYEGAVALRTAHENVTV